MRRTNLHTKPTETIDALDGDPGNWKDFKSGEQHVFAAGTIRRLMQCHGAQQQKRDPILG